MAFFHKRLFKIVILGFVFLIGTFFSFYKLIEAPAFWFDEGYFTQAAINIAKSGVWGIQIAPGQYSSLLTLSGGFPLLVPLAIAFKLFGVGVFQARMLSVVFILASIVAVFFAIKRIRSFYFGAGAALLLSTFPVFYGNGKMVLGEVPGLLFYALFIFYLTEWLESHKKKDALLTGLCLGLAMTTKVSFLLAGLPATILIALFYWKRWRLFLNDIPVFLLAALGPIVVWALTQFGPTDTLGSFFQTTFNHYNGDSTIQLFRVNIARFFTELSPLFLLVITSNWAASLCIRFYKKQTVSIAETHAVLFALFIIGIFLLSPGWYRYFFPAQVIALWFFPSALHDVLSVVSERIGRARLNASAFCIVGVLALAIANFYQTGFNSFVAGYYNSTKTIDMRREFSLLDKNGTYFFYNVPEVVIFMPGVSYHQFISGNAQYVMGEQSKRELSAGTIDYVVVDKQKYHDYKQELLFYEPEKIIAGKYLVLKKKNK